MATLRKIMNDTKDFYEVTVINTKGPTVLHEVMEPETDELTQVLFYSFDNDWELYDNYDNAYDELMKMNLKQKLLKKSKSSRIRF